MLFAKHIQSTICLHMYLMPWINFRTWCSLWVLALSTEHQHNTVLSQYWDWPDECSKCVMCWIQKNTQYAFQFSTNIHISCVRVMALLNAWINSVKIASFFRKKYKTRQIPRDGWRITNEEFNIKIGMAYVWNFNFKLPSKNVSKPSI